jgi:nicotinamide-nucleotide amidase
MRTEFIAIGSEMLSLDRIESNSLHLQNVLKILGLRLARKIVIGDDKEEIKHTIQDAMNRSGIIIISGGLGPTVDDLTVETVAEMLGRKKIFNNKAWSNIEGRLARLGREPNEGDKKQAYVVENAEILKNSVGQASGEHIIEGNNHLFLLPGVPSEFKSLIDIAVFPILKEIAHSSIILNRLIFKFASIPESELDIRISNRLSHLLPLPGEEFIITTKPGIQTVSIITRRTDEELKNRIQTLEDAFNKEFKENFYASEDLLLEEKVAALLTAKGLKLAVAESCTGGLLANRITDIPGASSFFLEGLVTYDNRAKMNLLGVKEDTLKTHGAVSAETAREMCSGLLERSEADMTVSITGIAGPDGGSNEKPVGTVFIGIADKFGINIEQRKISGTRSLFKEWATSVALNSIRLRILQYH